jgi:hypothetical protein
LLSFDEKKEAERNVGEIECVSLRMNELFGSNEFIVLNILI